MRANTPVHTHAHTFPQLRNPRDHVCACVYVRVHLHVRLRFCECVCVCAVRADATGLPCVTFVINVKPTETPRSVIDDRPTSAMTAASRWLSER